MGQTAADLGREDTNPEEHRMGSLARITLLGSSLVLALAAPASGQSRPPEVGPGRVAWFDLTTADLPRSREFYGKLFGWSFRAVPGSDLTLEIVVEGAAVGTLRVAEGPLSAHNGVIYVQVADMPTAITRVRELGGTVVPGFPFDLPGEGGAVGLVLDPSGHPVGLYARPRIPASGTQEPGDS